MNHIYAVVKQAKKKPTQNTFLALFVADERTVKQSIVRQYKFCTLDVKAEQFLKNIYSALIYSAGFAFLNMGLL